MEKRDEHGDFAEGQEREHDDTHHEGSFAEGQADEEEQQHGRHGDFAEGQEREHEEGREGSFSDEER
jgi:hypothetical protein